MKAGLGRATGALGLPTAETAAISSILLGRTWLWKGQSPFSRTRMVLLEPQPARKGMASLDMHAKDFGCMAGTMLGKASGLRKLFCDCGLLVRFHNFGVFAKQGCRKPFRACPARALPNSRSCCTTSKTDRQPGFRICLAGPRGRYQEARNHKS